jgi:hypothetical protein
MLRGYLTTSENQLYRVWVLETPLRLVLDFITISHLHNYNHLQLFITLCHIYTAYNLTRQCSILSVFTYSHFPCLSPIENLLIELLLTNRTKTANRFAYIATNSATKTEPVNTVASGHVMSCCLATDSQRVLLRDVSVFTTALPWKREWCRATRHGEDTASPIVV